MRSPTKHTPPGGSAGQPASSGRCSHENVVAAVVDDDGGGYADALPGVRVAGDDYNDDDDDAHTRGNNIVRCPLRPLPLRSDRSQGQQGTRSLGGAR